MRTVFLRAVAPLPRMHLSIRSERSIGRKPIPVDCAHCNNERWVTLPYEPFVPPAKRPSKAAKPR